MGRSLPCQCQKKISEEGEQGDDHDRDDDNNTGGKEEMQTPQQVESLSTDELSLCLI